MYDVASRDTFNALTNWLTDARTLASPSIVILLVGNKKDLEEEREVTFMEASRFAQENDLIFLETSARTGDSVEEAFLKCSKTILAKIETGELDPERIGSGTYGIWKVIFCKCTQSSSHFLLQAFSTGSRCFAGTSRQTQERRRTAIIYRAKFNSRSYLI